MPPQHCQATTKTHPLGHQLAEGSSHRLSVQGLPLPAVFVPWCHPKDTRSWSWYVLYLISELSPHARLRTPLCLHETSSSRIACASNTVQGKKHNRALCFSWPDTYFTGALGFTLCGSDAMSERPSCQFGMQAEYKLYGNINFSWLIFLLPRDNQ